MTNLSKTVAATFTALVALSGAAFADAHEFDVEGAYLDLSNDMDGDGEVTMDEIIEMNMAVFDTDGNGAIDADERGEAEVLLMQ
ncbi:MAG: hypothetical protein AAGL89_12765 [Pseudomonadota bacterium]